MSSQQPVERYQFVTAGPVPPLPLAYEPYFFNSPEYLALHADQGLRVFYLLDSKHQHTVAHFPFWVADGKAVSPLKGTFGSVQAIPDIPVEQLDRFLNFCLSELQKQDVREIAVRHYPLGYSEIQGAVTTDVLIRAGFSISQSQLNHAIQLDGGFEEKLHSSAKRRLQKCVEAGFRFQQEPHSKLGEIYDFAAACRAEQGKHLSLTKEQLQTLVSRFPEHYQLFSVRNGEEIIAASVTVRISGEVLYHFYPASSKAYQQYSPAVLLHLGLHQFASAEGYRFLDLGISSIPGDPYYSLMEFKERIGGVPSLKFAFSWRAGDESQ